MAKRSWLQCGRIVLSVGEITFLCGKDAGHEDECRVFVDRLGQYEQKMWRDFWLMEAILR